MSWRRDGAGAEQAGGHLGDALAGLVDGHLDHDTRERCLAHLAHCDTCRTETEDLRRLRARLLDLGTRTAPVPADLATRLLALQPEPAATAAVRPAPPLWVSGPVGAARPAGRPQPRRALTGPSRSPRVPRAAAAGAALVLGLGGALAIGSSTPARPSRPATPPAVNVNVLRVEQPAPGPGRAELVGVRPALVRTAR